VSASCQQDVPKSLVYIGSADAVGGHRTQYTDLFFAGAFSIRNGKFVRASAPDEFSIDHGGKP
jgi:hypothetical protein